MIEVRQLDFGGGFGVYYTEEDEPNAASEVCRSIIEKCETELKNNGIMLEKIMIDFINGRYDILVSTTIVENGIDIPNVNTIIINRADTFGLAQLYQLRGRVGRSSERAYAYLLVPAKRQVTKDAQRRLEVLQQFSDLGAGFHIASHDLEIRGAGHLLGEKQSGHIEAVGFDLYAELLDEAVRELKGEPPKEQFEPEVTLPIPAFLPDEYLPDVHQRLLFYKKLAAANSDEDIEAVREELVDRCGHPPAEVDALCKVMAVKAGLRALRLRALEHGPARLVITLGPDPLLVPEKLTKLLADAEREAAARAPKVAKPVRGAKSPAARPPEPKYRLTPDMKLVARIDPTLQGENLLAAADEVLRELARCAG
jgi:transcription-repair coupling factor (superfamily II helicase)